MHTDFAEFVAAEFNLFNFLSNLYRVKIKISAIYLCFEINKTFMQYLEQMYRHVHTKQQQAYCKNKLTLKQNYKHKFQWLFVVV